MRIYVDNLKRREMKSHFTQIIGNRNNNMWCHLFSSDEKALHAFAANLGLKREWFQRQGFAHYDLTPNRRAAALRLGATERDVQDWLKERGVSTGGERMSQGTML